MLSTPIFRKSITTIACVGFVVLSGCASVAVTGDTLGKRTAFALGVDQGSFTISDRVDEGAKTSYSVTTKSGIHYNCYVTGTFAVTGRVVSDALCSKKGEAMKNPLLQHG